MLPVPELGERWMKPKNYALVRWGLRLSGASSRMTCGASTFGKKLLQIERDRWTVLDVPVTIVSMWNTQRYEKWDLPLSPETSSAAVILYFLFFCTLLKIYYTRVHSCNSCLLIFAMQILFIWSLSHNSQISFRISNNKYQKELFCKNKYSLHFNKWMNGKYRMISSWISTPSDRILMVHIKHVLNILNTEPFFTGPFLALSHTILK